MRTFVHPLLTLAALVGLASLPIACTSPSDVPSDVGARDAGGGQDGNVAPRDSSADAADTGAAPNDTSTPDVDSASSPDAATTDDAATAVDAAAPVDAASAIDGGPAPAAIPVGHCGARAGLYFPATSWITTDIHDAPIRTTSGATTAWLSAQGGWGSAGHFQTDYSFVVLESDASTPTYMGEAAGYYTPDCDLGVAMPLPAGGHIEGETGYTCTSGGDCHLLVVDFAQHHLFEAYQATFVGGAYSASCNLVWDTRVDVWGAPPASGVVPDPSVRNWGNGQGCTSTDAAGFPVAPLLLTVGDVMSGHVQHVLRFALPNARMQRSATAGAPGPTWVWPATHAGGPNAVDPSAPIYGSRFRLHDPFDIAAHGMDPTNPTVQAVVWGLQHYGMILADGGNIPLMAEDASGCGTTWADLGTDSHTLYGILPSDFDVLDTGGSGNGYDCMRNPAR